MRDLEPEDRYHLRKAQMDADRKALDAQKAQQELERLLLELEHQYGLLAEGRSIDPRAAAIQGSPSVRRDNGKGSAEELKEATVKEAVG